jgi:hypothetical protein
MASLADPSVQAEYVSDIKQTQEAAENAKAKGEQAAAVDMLQLYANLLSINAKYAWNKIVHKRMASDPYMDLQGCSNKGPRGFLCKSSDDCVMFHLLTMFPSNAAEQDWYYITNVLKTPQRISVRQFVQRVEQLNSYTVQLLCWFYSLSPKPSTTPINVPFAEADLVSHVLWMCPLRWQDQINLHEKGMTPVDIVCFLCLSRLLSAHVPKKCPTHNPTRKLPTRVRKETRDPVLSLE